MLETNQKRILWRVSLAAFWLLVLALIWDFGRFLSDYYFYHERAQAGAEQLSLPLMPSEVLVVLTGDVGRIPRALDLLRRRKSDQLIISGAAKGVSLTELINQQGASASNLKPIWNRITLESQSSSTLENALYTRKLLGSQPVSRLIVVTSDYHMERSLSVFRNVFPETQIVAYSVPSAFSGPASPHFLWKTGAEYWKTFFYRAGRLLGID